MNVMHQCETHCSYSVQNSSFLKGFLGPHWANSNIWLVWREAVCHSDCLEHQTVASLIGPTARCWILGQYDSIWFLSAFPAGRWMLINIAPFQSLCSIFPPCNTEKIFAGIRAPLLGNLFNLFTEIQLTYTLLFINPTHIGLCYKAPSSCSWRSVSHHTGSKFRLTDFQNRWQNQTGSRIRFINGC